MSKPKKSQYKESEADQTSTAVSLADKKFYREAYLPKLKEKRDRSETDDIAGVAEGRAQADTMQALTARPTLAATRSVDTSADIASAAGAQLLQAANQGAQGQRQDQLGVLKSARGLQSTATAGLANAAKIATTETLARAKEKGTRTSAIFNAGNRLAGAFGQNLSDANAYESSPDTDPDGQDQGNFFQKGFGGIDPKGRGTT